MSAGSRHDHRSRWVGPGSLALPAVTLLAGLVASLGACVPAAVDSAAEATPKLAERPTTAPSDPSEWVGRWHGSKAAMLRIMPGPAAKRFKLVLRSADGITTRYLATAAGDRLIFDRLNQTLAIRAGRGKETNDPALTGLTTCLILVPGRRGFCRHRDTADGLPLATGAFVAVKSACRTAEPAEILYFDGRALSRSGQNACRAAVISQQGATFYLSDRCAAKANAGAARVNETITAPDAHHLSLRAPGQATRLYRYCARGLLPPGLRSQASRD